MANGLAGFNELLQTMAQMDAFTGILPFLLTFLIFNYALQRLDFFSDDRDTGIGSGTATAISVIFAFFVAQFLVNNPSYQSFFLGYTARITIGMIGILGLTALLSLVGVKLTDSIPIVTFIVVLIAIGAFSIAGGTASFIPGGAIPVIGISLRDVYQLMFESGIIYLLVIGGVVLWAARVNENDDRDEESLIEALVGRNT